MTRWLVGAIAVILLASACSSGETGHGTTVSTPASSSSSASSSTSAASSSTPPTSASAASSSSSSAVAACGDTAFAISATPTDSATGHSSFVLLFRNKQATACTVFGYPGLDAISASGATLAHAKRTLNGFAGGTTSIPTVTVHPGETVSARVEWTNFNTTTGGDCATSDHILATPANTADTVRLPVSVTVCNLQVHPTVPGATGNT